MRRQNQGALDLAALSAARNLAVAEASARKALSDNRVPDPEVLIVTLGSYSPGASADPSKRFAADGTPANAVRLQMTTSTSVIFGRAILGGASPKLTTTATSVTFSASEMAAGAVKTVSTTSALQSALTSLTKNLSVTVNLGLLGLSLGTPKLVGDTLAAAVSPVGALLDPALNTLLNTLGVGVGQADVWVRGVRCDGSALTG